jgi:hypothetical protein
VWQCAAVRAAVCGSARDSVSWCARQCEVVRAAVCGCLRLIPRLDLS